MSNRANLLRFLRLWHRRISLFLLLWVFFVALSGIGLNHSEDFGLDTTPLPNTILKIVYDVDLPEVESYYLLGKWFSVVDGHQLYMNTRSIGYCNGMAGLATLADEIYIGCIDSVYVLNADGEIIEQLNAHLGLPVPIQQFGSCSNLPCLISDNHTFAFDPARFKWEAAPTALQPMSAGNTPEGLNSQLQQKNAPQDFHLERLIRDLHSGLFFGLGPWLMDLFAIALMVLSLTGLTMWWLTRPK